MEETFEQGIAQAEGALEKYSADFASVLPALEKLRDARQELCDQRLWKLKEVQVERAEGEVLCARGEERLGATHGKLQGLAATLEALKVEDHEAVGACKSLDLAQLDASLRSLRNQKRLASRIMGIKDLEEEKEGSDNGDLTGVVQHRGGDKPFRVATSGRSACDVADDLWNLLP